MSAIGSSVAAAKPPATSKTTPLNDLLFVQLAREIAMDIHPLETILKNHAVSDDDWQVIRANPQFNEYLRIYIQEWNSATSTEQRVKIKAMSFVEEALPEMFARVHSPDEALPGKVKAFEVVTKIAGLGAQQQGGPATGEKFSITINMGADEKLVINATQPKAITAEDQ